MNKIVINKQKKDENNKSFEFKYNGLSLEELSEDEKRRIELFLNASDHINMEKNVQILRTILKKHEEIELEIMYEDDEKFEQVVYNVGKLLLYEIKHKKCNFEFSNHYYTGVIYKNLNRYKSRELYDRMLDAVTRLENIDKLKLTSEQKTIIEMYKLFYDEEPTFADCDINIKIQTMMVILACYGINLNNKYSFSCTDENDLPSSFYLQSLLQTSYEGITNIKTSIKLRAEVIETIKIIGEVVREQMVYSDKETNIKVLIYISKIAYANKYDLPIDENMEKITEISQYSGCSDEEIKTTIQMARKIEKNLYN